MSIYLGDFVKTTKHRYTGRVYMIHHSCPQDGAWIAGQTVPVTDDERNEHWVSILVHPSGSIVTPMSDCTVIDPFEFHNPWADMYFRDSVKK
jgi:hypothetical protein